MPGTQEEAFGPRQHAGTAWGPAVQLGEAAGLGAGSAHSASYDLVPHVYPEVLPSSRRLTVRIDRMSLAGNAPPVK